MNNVLLSSTLNNLNCKCVAIRYSFMLRRISKQYLWLCIPFDIVINTKVNKTQISNQNIVFQIA